MRTIVIPRFGDPDVLETRDLPIPEPGAGQVLIRVAYIGVNYADIMARRGGYNVDTLPFVPGHEVSGYVHTIGAGVEGLRVGQPVAALTIEGGYAEFVLARAVLTFPLDQSIDLVMAAGFPAIVLTSYNLLADVARIRPGESVLIHGAAGGVGTTAVQIARHLKAGRIIGTVGSLDKVPYALSFGYDQIIRREDFVQTIQEATERKGIDIVLDPAGEPTRSQSFSILAPFGRLIVFGNASDQPAVPLSPNDLLINNRAVMGYSLSSLSRSAPQILANTARKALNLIINGEIRIDITCVLPLEQAAEAHKLIESRGSTGKLVLRV
ncbi:MAG: NADPH:quinone oxidoreductase family protein [Ktedonobacteraceae bacterium]|nr:NADPH:quinone oxidoreductase family protein [Ktedonobacteraceae bacterium]